MSDRAHLFLGLTALCSIYFIVRMVRKHHLRSKYSLLWISIALVMAPVAAFPGLLDRTSYAMGISYPPATFLVLAVAFLFLVVVQFSWELSRLEERSRSLAEEVALLRAAQDRPTSSDARPRDPTQSPHAPGDDSTES